MAIRNSALPFDYVIDKGRHLIITTAQGHVTVAEVRTKLESLLSDPEFDPHLHEVIDATQVKKMYVPVTDVFDALNLCPRSKKSRTAWVVTKSGKWATLAQMFAAWMSVHGECTVFHDLPSALAWIAEAPLTDVHDMAGGAGEP